MTRPATGVPVIDLFAGPGGLGEGFSAFADGAAPQTFDVRLSIEKDPLAHATLKLRTFFRELRRAGRGAVSDYYEFVRQRISMGELCARHPAADRHRTPRRRPRAGGQVDRQLR